MYFDSNGFMWCIETEGLTLSAVAAAQKEYTTSDCSGPVYDVYGGMLPAPRFTYWLYVDPANGDQVEYRVRNDNAPIQTVAICSVNFFDGCNASDPCMQYAAVPETSTTLASMPTVAATPPLHPVWTPP